MKNNYTPEIRFSGFTGDWELHKLGEGTSKIGDGLHGTPKYSDNGDVAFINGNNLVNGKIMINSQTKYVTSDQQSRDDKELNQNTILMSINGTIGNLAWYNGEKVMLGKSAAYIKVSSFDKYFMYQLLQTSKIKNYFLDNLTGSTIKNLGLKTIRETPTLVPRIDEQQRIGHFLKKLDESIALYQQELTALKLTKKGFMQKMFPKEGKSVPEVRFSGCTGDWEQRTIGEWGYFYYGKSAPKWSVTSDATTPCVRYGELYTKHKEKIDKIYSFTNIQKENLKFSTGKEVLIPRVGEDPLDFANCSWLSIPGVAIGEMISVYNTKQNPLFTAYMFNALLKHEFAKRVEGGNVSNLYFAYLENISVSYPSIEEQDKIASFFDNLSTLITIQQQELDVLKETKKAFLQKMFV